MLVWAFYIRKRNQVKSHMPENSVIIEVISYSATDLKQIYRWERGLWTKTAGIYKFSTLKFIEWSD